MASTTTAFIPYSLFRSENVVTYSPQGLGNKKRHLLSSYRRAKARSNDGGDEKATKKAALEGVLQKIEKSYGQGSIVKLGDADNMRVDCISSGALTLGEYNLLHTRN
jgi:hypothetical protein